MTPLERLIRARIAERGPMRVDTYMAICLGHPDHGTYATRDPLGAAGDFVTAPEVSQMFGELIGAWAAQVWSDQGRPAPFVLAELGPGRGTMLGDALRVADRVPGFRDAAQLWLVETGAVLRARQAEVLQGRGARWVERVEALPQGPAIVLANEFFDALPVRQFQRLDALWRERLVGIETDRLTFTWGRAQGDRELDARFPLVGDGGMVEVNASGEAIVAVLGRRIAADGGALLVVDYGAWDGTGDTLQGLRGHAPVPVLAAPGSTDLTAHVGFRALAEAARPARAHGPVPQGVFLERLGITARAQALARSRSDAEVDAVAAAHRRLTHPEEMGNLFQVLALVPERAPTPPGFGP